MNVQNWLRIIKGENREWYADLTRLGLAFASLPYGLASELRNRFYDYGALPVRGVPVPVISIGNLTVGGTGKTPTVAWIVQQLQKLGERPGILSRGYHALKDSENDEKKVLDSICPGVPHKQGSDRFKSATSLLAETETSAIVLDDAFQHRRMHRDLDLVLIDALNPWGHGWILPRGLLRERCSGLSRADLVFLTRCDLVPSETIQEIQRQIRHWTSAPILRTHFQPTGFVDGAGNTFPLESLQGKNLFAFCGIGNPAGFRNTLASFGDIRDDRFRSFPDHHHYSELDLEQLHETGNRSQTDLFVTTRKDLVKLPQDGILGVPCWGLEIELCFQDDPAPLFQLLKVILPQRP